MPEGIVSFVSPAAKLYEEVFRCEQSNIEADLQAKAPANEEIIDAVTKYLKRVGIEVFKTNDYKCGVIISMRGEYGKLLELPDVLAKEFKGMGIGDAQVRIEGPGEENELSEYASNVRINGSIRISFKSPIEL